MTLGLWHEEPISKQQDREAFDCGEEALNGFLRRHARKAQELGGRQDIPGARSMPRITNQFSVL